MRPHVADAELVVRRRQRRRSAPRRSPGRRCVSVEQHVREVLAADHRPPRPGQLARSRRPRRPATVTPGPARRAAPPRPASAAVALDVHVGQRRHGVPPCSGPGVPVVSTYGGCGHREHVAAGVVERLPRAVRRRRRRTPGSRSRPPPAPRSSVTWRAAGDGHQAARAGRAAGRRRRRRPRSAARSGCSQSAVRRSRAPAPPSLGRTRRADEDLLPHQRLELVLHRARGDVARACRRRRARCRARP